MNKGHFCVRGAKIGALMAALLFLFSLGADGAMQRSFAQASTDPCCVTGMEPECAEDGAMIKALEEARAANITAQMLAAQEAHDQGTKAAVESNFKSILGDIGDKYCFSIYNTAFEDIIGSIFGNLLQGLVNSIFGMIQSFLNSACEAVVTFVNNALSQICIPLPNISLPGYNFASINHSYCDVDGRYISAADIVGLRQRPFGSVLVPRVPSVRDTARDALERPVF